MQFELCVMEWGKPGFPTFLGGGVPVLGSVVKMVRRRRG